MSQTIEDLPGADDGSPTLRGVVAQTDGGVVRVLVGDSEDEWFFPAHVFPASTAAGDQVWLIKQRGRFGVLGAPDDRLHPDVRGFADRINSLRIDRRGLTRDAHDPRGDGRVPPRGTTRPGAEARRLS